MGEIRHYNPTVPDNMRMRVTGGYGASRIVVDTDMDVFFGMWSPKEDKAQAIIMGRHDQIAILLGQCLYHIGDLYGHDSIEAIIDLAEFTYFSYLAGEVPEEGFDPPSDDLEDLL